MTAGDRRVDPLTGAEVWVVGDRQHRPNLPDGPCPFCPGGLEAPEPYTTRWFPTRCFPNRWPAMPGQRCEVVLYSPDHDATFWSLGRAGARAVIDLWAERTAALGARPDVADVLVFENRGPEIGATITHPHGQIYAFDGVPRQVAQEGDPANDPVGERLVHAGGGWRTFVPSASAWPVAALVVSERPVPDLPALDDAGRDGLAAALVDLLARLDQLHDAPMPYMLWVRQRPTDGRPSDRRLHCSVISPWRARGVMRHVAAVEIASGVFYNPVVPERLAEDLRALPGWPG